MTRRGRETIRTAIFVLFLSTFFLPNLGIANSKSSKLVQSGHKSLSHQNYSNALDKFRAATEADPTDGETYFFQGVALNRLGLHRAAAVFSFRCKKAGL